MEILLVILILFILFEVPTCFGMGLIFKKMGLDFKLGIIPFYNKMILIKKYKLPMYHLILMFIPLAGFYTNFIIYSEMCKAYNKEFLYILELTFFPFIYNIFLGLEIKEKQTTSVDNYLEDQKSLYEKDNTERQENKDEYVWHPERKFKSDTVYKASRNQLNAKVNIKPKVSGNTIIDNKKRDDGISSSDDVKICPKCGAKMSADALVCFLCGTKF